MSSVLEALKKAENERRDALAPSVLAGQRSSPQKQLRPRRDWRWLLWTGLIACNIGLAAWLLTMRQPEAITKQSAVETSLGREPTPVSPETEELAGPDVAPDSDDGKESDQVVGLQVVELELPMSSPMSEPRVSNAVDEVLIYTAADEKVPADKEAAKESPVAVQQPPVAYEGKDFDSLKLGAHIYSDTASRRMIMLNNVAYRQGSQLANDWYLVEIGREAMVVEKGGTAYSIPLVDLR